MQPIRPCALPLATQELRTRLAGLPAALSGADRLGAPQSARLTWAEAGCLKLELQALRKGPAAGTLASLRYTNPELQAGVIRDLRGTRAKYCLPPPLSVLH